MFENLFGTTQIKKEQTGKMFSGLFDIQPIEPKKELNFYMKKVIDNAIAQRTKTLPEHLGGGEYVASGSTVFKTPRSYADLDTREQQERDHIISVALGGTSSKTNLQYLKTTDEGRQEGKVSVEQKAINDFLNGRISVAEARAKIAHKQQQIKGLIPEQSVFNNLWGGIKQTGEDIVNRNVEGLKTVKDFGKSILQFPQRALTSTFIQPAADVLSIIKDKNIEAQFTPKTKFEKMIFGEEPIKGIFERVEDVQKISEDTLQKIGFDKGTSQGMALAIAPLFVGGLTGIDLTPFGGSSNLAKQLARTKDFTRTSSLLRKAKVSEDLIETYAPKFTKIKTEAEALKGLKSLESIAKQTTPLKTQALKPIEPLAQEARKYKSADEFIKSFDEGRRGIFVDYTPTKRLLADIPENTPLSKYIKDDEITIYRGIDVSKKGIKKQINDGDFVATSRELAETYSMPENVVAKTVKAKDVYIDKTEFIPEDFSRGVDNLHIEAVYNSKKPFTKQQLTDIYNQAKGVKGVVKPIIKETDQGIVKKLTQSLKEAKPLRGQQEAIFTKERGAKLARSLEIRETVGKGEKGFYAELGALKGEMNKVNFESVKKQFSQENIDELFKMAVDSPYVTEWEKINVRTGLVKMLDGKLPTESELRLLKEVYGEDLVKVLKNKQGLFEKLKNIGYEIANIPRAVMTSFDFSFPFRQGIFTAFRHPKIFTKQFGSMFKAAFSEKQYKGILQSIKDSPNYLKMRRYKLPLTDVNAKLTDREEAFMSSYAEKIPLVGKFIRGSNRAYTTFANKLRANLFDYFVDLGKKVGIKDEQKFLSSASDFIGNATGRGNLGRLSGAAKALNTTFFSPRLMTSRINLMRPDKYVKLHPTVRKDALKSLFAFLGGGMTILGLAKMAGGDDVEIGADPRSANFGKIKIKDTRMDIWGGFQQYIRLMGQLMSGKIISSTTGNITLLGEGYRPLNRLDIIANFFKGKEAPIASFITTWLSGKDFKGEDFDIKQETKNRFTPMVIQDAIDLIKSGDIELLPLQLPAVFGVGTQTYFREATRKKEDLERLPKEQAAKEFNKLIKEDSEMAKKVNDLFEAEEIGLTPTDVMLKKLGVQNGKRAEFIIKELDKLKTKEEKAEYYQSLIDKRIITKDVSDQLLKLLK